MQKIVPFLWFNGQAEEAMNLYVATFPNSKAGTVTRQGDQVFSVEFELDGVSFYGLNGGPMYSFTPAISMFVRCQTQDEVDTLWHKLLAGGGVENRCGWLQDRFGLSWQIVPVQLTTLLRDPDPVKAGRVMQAMMGMVKLDIAALQQAHAGA